MSDSTDTGGTRVSTLELFFDLVFVFTITQVALIVEHHPSWSSVGQAMLELVVIFRMYGGYAWLTNTVGTATPRLRGGGDAAHRATEPARRGPDPDRRLRRESLALGALGRRSGRAVGCSGAQRVDAGLSQSTWITSPSGTA
jgi:hypothetical protein